MSRTNYKVLVAEDDPFQRLSIIDILKLTHYDVTPVENGAQALEKLMDTDNHFDLVLLDLLMPEKSGKDVLEAIMQDKRLCKLPVIVMSAKNDKSIISECLKTGAKTFIVKPLRVQECRGFENYIGTTSETEAEQSLSKYSFIKALGSGAAGSVDLVKHKETGKLFALKTIPLSHLNEKERTSAECEVHFLKVLVGPTLIKSYQSYIEKDKIYIIMEYAEGGNLGDKIRYAKNKKQPFDTDTILNWISQVILGVMLMHSKNILHRDLKCQNMFLTKEGILKIGDFGISKELETMSKLAETNVGTPYFMAPEVCRGDPYGEKADVWAIGCILYELALLRKPFDADSIQGVFDKIIHKPLDFYGEELNTDVRMLIIAMLDKDPSKRPSIWELSYIPCINDRINNFIKEHKCEDSVNCVFERRAIQDEGKEQEGEQMFSVFDVNKLDVLAHLIRSDIKIEETKPGWFRKTVKCANGNEIIRWIRDHVEKDDQKADDICLKMLNQGVIFRIDGKDVFQGNYATLYQFYEDREDIPCNMVRPWKGDVDNAIDVSAELVKLIEEIYFEAFVEEEDANVIHAEDALRSSKFDSFLSNIAQLEKVDLNFKTFNEGLCFFLNVYQCMYIHAFLRYMSNFRERENGGGMFQYVLSYVSSDFL